MDQSELAKALKAQNDNLQLITGTAAEQATALEHLRNENTELRARVLDLEQKGVRRPTNGGAEDEPSQIEKALEASENFKLLRRGEVKSARIPIPAKALERKSVITSTITSGTIAAPDRSRTIVAPSERRVWIRDLLPSVATDSGSTEFVRELVYSNNAGPQWDASSPSPGREGAVKNASSMSLELVNSPVTTIAHHFTVSRQALDDSAALRQHIETRGIYGWNLEVDDELLTGDGTAGALNGLLNQATAFAYGDTNQTALDTIRKAITQLALAEHVASGVVLNPRDAEALELAKDGEQRYMGVVVYISGKPYVWRIPIAESNAMSAGQFLVGAFDMAATIRDRQEAHVEISLDHADYRTRNLALVLIEGRLGLEIHRPIALVKGSLFTPG